MEVIYDRARILTYDRLKLLKGVREFEQKNTGSSVLPARIRLKSFCVARLADGLKEHKSELQAIRTDLDEFSCIEISALAYDGYEAAKAALKDLGYVPKVQHFSPVNPELKIDWGNLNESDRPEYATHLKASQYRFSVLRWARRARTR
jgi:hypothetical protein